jgi:hypothetical protein
MMRLPRFTLLFALALLLTVGAAIPAEAAKRRVPFGFFASVLPPEMSDPQQVSDAAIEQQMALMAASGVETVRISFGSSVLEVAPGVYDWRRFDRLVAAAALHRVAVLGNVSQPTKWNSEQPNNPEWRRFPPKDPRPFAELMRQLVLRYGPNGSFWAQNPGLPRVPIRQWQVWNEQTAPWHWRHRPWAPGYARLLKASYRAIHGADPGAKVVAGSLVAYGRFAPWDSIGQLYRAGAKRFFDVVAIHPFTNNRSVSKTVGQTLEFIRRVRAQMRRRGDARKPIILTELTWPAAVGKVPTGGLVSFATTAAGQASRLKAVYRQLARERRRLRVTQAYWFTWATPYDTGGSLSTVSFRFSGLTRLQGGVFSPMPLLNSYAGVAAQYEGCRKSSDARSCR